MRNLKLFLLFLIAGSIHSQSFIYYRLGQKISSRSLGTENACLVIKNDKIALSRLHLIPGYGNVKIIKFIGFKDIHSDPDNVVAGVASKLKPHILIFENCDLSMITEPVKGLEELKELQLTKGTCFYENDLFYALKNSSLQTLIIQQPEEEFLTDSLHLLKHLTSVKISNASVTGKPNKTIRLQAMVDGNLYTTTISYYGKLYKNENYQAVETKENRVASAGNEIAKPVPMSCIKQPVPGIDINDTVFSFASDSEVEFVYGSGSRIAVDKNAFVTKDGRSYSGPVNVFYREFRNPVEIMLSGIPMKNVVNGEEKLFRSGGMYEIQAFDKFGNELKTRSDTSVKINFVLTDTSSEFGFYSLNDNGTWTKSDNKIVSTNLQATANNAVPSKAVQAYLKYLSARQRAAMDTTSFSDRYESPEYLYTYRKDNLTRAFDTASYCIDPNKVFKYPSAKGLFRIKYVKQTKNKEIIFKIIPEKKVPYFLIPKYAQVLLNRTYMYAGELTREEFRKKYNWKIKCWDLRPLSGGNELNLEIKTSRNRIDLPCKAVTFTNKGEYEAGPKTNYTLNRMLQRIIVREEKVFQRKLAKRQPLHYNNANIRNIGRNQAELAYQYSKKFQTAEELKMDFTQWCKYVSPFQGAFMTFAYNNEVSAALVSSGMGIKNIDCYIHSGEVQEMLVNYQGTDMDSVSDQYHAVLFKKINTTYPLSPTFDEKKIAMHGYYFPAGSNYLVRFSENGYMQVTKPKEFTSARRGDRVTVSYEQQYPTKGLNSNQITKLILE